MLNMKKITINFDDYKNEFRIEIKRMEKLLQFYNEKAKKQGKKLENYNNKLVEITEAAVVNGLINCLGKKGQNIISTISKSKYTMLGYYFKMITSHIKIFEDFEFYNIALITRYLLESITGILLNYNNLHNYFSKMNENSFENTFSNYNYGITRKIEEKLGSKFSKIYKTLSRYIHPMSGPLFGLDPKLVSKRNLYIIKSAIQIYIKATKEIFKICDYDLKINFENHILEILTNETNNAISGSND